MAQGYQLTLSTLETDICCTAHSTTNMLHQVSLCRHQVNHYIPFNIMFIGHPFFFNKSVFRHLKLEIALAIPASNDKNTKSDSDD